VIHESRLHAFLLRQPAGPSRGSSSTPAPSPRARSVASRISTTSIYGSHSARAFYSWDEAEQTHLPFALNVLTIWGRQISDVTAFVCRSIERPENEAYARWPEEPIERGRLNAYFERFGPPERVD